MTKEQQPSPWSLALLAFLPLSLGLAGPSWGNDVVSNLEQTPNSEDTLRVGYR